MHIQALVWLCFSAGTPYSFRPAAVLRQCSSVDTILLMTHQPQAVEFVLRHEPQVAKRVRLYVAGHTHGGQLWPLTWLTSISFRFNAGEYQMCSAWSSVHTFTHSLCN